MKHTIFLFALGVFLLSRLTNCSKCDDSPIDCLPDATSSGNNTFGCLVNNEAFVACKDFGSLLTKDLNPKLTAQRRSTTNGIVFDIYGIDYCSEDTLFKRNDIDFHVRLDTTGTLTVEYASFGFDHLTEFYCSKKSGYFNRFDPTNQANTIQLDTIFRASNSTTVVYGTFNLDLYSDTCPDTIKIRDGRFDAVLSR